MCRWKPRPTSSRAEASTRKGSRSAPRRSTRYGNTTPRPGQDRGPINELQFASLSQSAQKVGQRSIEDTLPSDETQCAHRRMATPPLPRSSENRLRGISLKYLRTGLDTGWQTPPRARPLLTAVRARPSALPQLTQPISAERLQAGMLIVARALRTGSTGLSGHKFFGFAHQNSSRPSRSASRLPICSPSAEYDAPR